MIWNLIKLELQYKFRRAGFYFSVLFLIAEVLLAVSILVTPLGNEILSRLSIGILGSTNFLNTEFAIATIFSVLTIFNSMIWGDFVGYTFQRDYSSKSNYLLSSMPISKVHIIISRLISTILIISVTYILTVVSIEIYKFMPWVNSELFLNFNFYNYLYPFLLLVLPNAFLILAVTLYFCAKIKSEFASGTAMYIILFTQTLLSFIPYNAGTKIIKSFLDPTGLTALNSIGENLTFSQLNSLSIIGSSNLIINRIILFCISAVFLFLAFKEFSFADASTKLQKLSPVESKPKFFELHSRQIGGFKHFLMVLKNKLPRKASPSLIIGSIVYILFSISPTLLIRNISGNYETFFSSQIVELISQSLTLIGFTMGAGILLDVWIAKRYKTDELENTSPLNKPTEVIVTLISNLVFGIAILSSLYILGILYLSLNQTGINWNLLSYAYIEQLLVITGYVLFYAIVSRLTNSITILGLAIFAQNFGLPILLGATGFSHPLLNLLNGNYGSSKSELTNNFIYLIPNLVYFLHWIILSIILTIFAVLWQKLDKTSNLKPLFKNYLLSISKSSKTLIILFLALILSTANILYNTNIVNSFPDKNLTTQTRSNYEKKFAYLKDKPNLTINEANIKLNYQSSIQKLSFELEYVLQNYNLESVDELLLGGLSSLSNITISCSETEDIEIVGSNQEALRFRLVKLKQPAITGKTCILKTKFECQKNGFSAIYLFEVCPINQGGDIYYFNNILDIGYNSLTELTNPKERAENNLEKQNLLPGEDQPKKGIKSLISNHLDSKINVEVTTDNNLTAFSPGELVSDEVKDDSRIMKYQLDKSLYFGAITISDLVLSAKQFSGINLQFWHHQNHDQNSDHILQAMEDTIKYFEKISPYPSRILKIVELPSNVLFEGQAFKTMILLNESGFLRIDLERTDNLSVDDLYQVIAHETSHQWWGHQLHIPATKGSMTLLESLTQYTSFQVYKAKYGEDNFRQLLKLQLDQYFKGRATGENNSTEEALANLNDPLATGYVHYFKGGVVLENIANLIGQDKFQSILKSYLVKNAYNYRDTTLTELIDRIKEASDQNIRENIDQLFNQIVIYDIETREAKIEKVENKFKIEIKGNINKYLVKNGQEEKINLKDLVSIEFYTQEKNEKGEYFKIIESKLVQVTNEEINLIFELDNKPTHVKINGNYNLLDRQFASSPKEIK
jgi:ABC-2 type transport system permease protein